jgi:clan AA aspartic protease (TIGR02281 family)
MREKVTADLLQAIEPAAREEVLIAALYEISRDILPRFGAPRKSLQYHEQQGAVGELISFVSIPLVRSGGAGRSLAVLSEIAEGCSDPQLKRKLSVYAQEIRAKSSQAGPSSRNGRKFFLAAACCSGLLLGIYLLLPPSPEEPHATDKKALQEGAAGRPSTPFHPSSKVAMATAVAPPVEAQKQDPGGVARQPESAQAEGKGAAAPGEPVTRVRFVGNQVLVPVTLRNGDEKVRVEMVLDTGATRTAVHEEVAAKLGIDPRSTKASQSEVADGRSISSRTARIDAVSVGPFAMTSAEIELIPYRGDGIHAGLLGMDFLARHRYQIDIEHELIRWF